jgi:hypothetical protein
VQITSAGLILGTILLFLGYLVVQESLKGSWTPIHTLFVGPIAAAFMQPEGSDIYIVVQGGSTAGDRASSLLQRNESGEWQLISESFTVFSPIELLVTYPGDIPKFYVSLFGRGILKSDDQGSSWRLVNDGLGSHLITALLSDPLDPDFIYAGSGDNKGLYESQNGGQSWAEVTNPEIFGYRYYLSLTLLMKEVLFF